MLKPGFRTRLPKILPKVGSALKSRPSKSLPPLANEIKEEPVDPELRPKEKPPEPLELEINCKEIKCEPPPYVGKDIPKISPICGKLKFEFRPKLEPENNENVQTSMPVVNKDKKKLTSMIEEIVMTNSSDEEQKPKILNASGNECKPESIDSLRSMKSSHISSTIMNKSPLSSLKIPMSVSNIVKDKSSPSLSAGRKSGPVAQQNKETFRPHANKEKFRPVPNVSMVRPISTTRPEPIIPQSPKRPAEKEKLLSAPATPATMHSEDWAESEMTLNALYNEPTERANRYPNLTNILNSPKKRISKKEIPEKRRRLINPNNPPPRSEMTMFDLLYYTPRGSPMKHSKPNQSVEISVIEEEEESEPEDNAIVPKVEEDSSEVSAPKVIINELGEIVIDESSLIVKRKPVEAPLETVIEDEMVTYSSFRKPVTKHWTRKETVKFYRALSIVGTDFGLMESMFPNRSRQELKKKFKKEEKRDCTLIQKIMYRSHLFDESIFQTDSDSETETIEMVSTTEGSPSMAIRSSKRKRHAINFTHAFSDDDNENATEEEADVERASSIFEKAPTTARESEAPIAKRSKEQPPQTVKRGRGRPRKNPTQPSTTDGSLESQANQKQKEEKPNIFLNFGFQEYAVTPNRRLSNQSEPLIIQEDFSIENDLLGTQEIEVIIEENILDSGQDDFDLLKNQKEDGDNCLFESNMYLEIPGPEPPDRASPVLMSNDFVGNVGSHIEVETTRNRGRRKTILPDTANFEHGVIKTSERYSRVRTLKPSFANFTPIDDTKPNPVAHNHSKVAKRYFRDRPTPIADSLDTNKKGNPAQSSNWTGPFPELYNSIVNSTLELGFESKVLSPRNTKNSAQRQFSFGSQASTLNTCQADSVFSTANAHSESLQSDIHSMPTMSTSESELFATSEPREHCTDNLSSADEGEPVLHLLQLCKTQDPFTLPETPNLAEINLPKYDLNGLSFDFS